MGSISFRIVTVVLFTAAIFTLSALTRMRRNTPLTEENSKEEVVQQPVLGSNQNKFVYDEKLDFSVPSHIEKNHLRFVKAHGRINSVLLEEKRQKLGLKTPKILIWKWFDPAGPKENEFTLSYKCGGCRITTDRSFESESVAIIFFNNISLKELDLPVTTNRKPDQVFVLWSRETPSKTSGFREYLEQPPYLNFFNLTFYFRRDSDVRHYFGNRELALRTSKSFEEKLGWDTFLGSKTNEALWFVSNCDHTEGAIKRLKYAQRLIDAGLKVDTFGKCFSHSDERTDSNVVDEKSYRFYLAFENSIHCPDYITEKFWRNSIQKGLVPIVWGPTKADIEAVAPPHSFIHSEDFASVDDLVSYLKYLTVNETAYFEYHQWRNANVDESIQDEDIRVGHESSFCRLCKRQVFEKHPPKTISSASEWFYETNYVDNECLGKHGKKKLISDPKYPMLHGID